MLSFLEPSSWCESFRRFKIRQPVYRTSLCFKYKRTFQHEYKLCLVSGQKSHKLLLETQAQSKPACCTGGILSPSVYSICRFLQHSADFLDNVIVSISVVGRQGQQVLLWCLNTIRITDLFYSLFPINM